MNEHHLQGLAILTSSEVQASIAAVRRIAGYELTADLREPFLYFHSFITGPPIPAYISAWRSSPGLEHWYRQHVDGILSDAQRALSAAHYHANRLKDMERDIVDALSTIDFANAIPLGSTVGVGGTDRMDFEYHAFIFAARRSLDYMTKGIAAYFRQTFHSFRNLPSTLQRFSNNPVAMSLVAAHAKVAPDVAFLLSDGSNKSVRDLIAHYRHVDVGALNLTHNGLFFAGGGENLNLSPSGNVKFEIGEAIDARLRDLQSALTAMIHAFVDAAQTVENT